jgi:methionine-rich copper-binding protein CopC
MTGRALLALLAAFSLWTGAAAAHALAERSTPAADAALDRAPAVVTIAFDSELEPVFSKLIVTNDQGEKVSQGDGEIAPGNRKVLTTRLAAGAGKGAYHVHWDVVARDGHHAKGDYVFTVK